jgi:hypothetical protein
MPKSRDFVMMLDGKGCPRFIGRTTQVTVKSLSGCEVFRIALRHASNFSIEIYATAPQSGLSASEHSR